MKAFLNALIKLVRTNNPIQILRNLLDNCYLIELMVRRDLSQRYQGSYLGILWSFINPLLMLLIYTFVFSVVFKARWRPTSEDLPLGEFAITLFAGLIPYTIFSEVVQRATNIVSNNVNYVKKVVFPLEILVVILAGTAFISSLINIGILVVASLIFLKSIPATIIFLPLAYIPLLLLSLGFGWFLASLGVYIRDIGHIVVVAVQVLFFMSPIFYPTSSVPPKMQFVLTINPIATIVTCFRNSLLWGELIPLRSWGFWTIIGGFVAFFGYIWFMATRKGFADVI